MQDGMHAAGMSRAGSTGPAGQPAPMLRGNVLAVLHENNIDVVDCLYADALGMWTHHRFEVALLQERDFVEGFTFAQSEGFVSKVAFGVGMQARLLPELRSAFVRSDLDGRRVVVVQCVLVEEDDEEDEEYGAEASLFDDLLTNEHARTHGTSVPAAPAAVAEPVPPTGTKVSPACTRSMLKRAVEALRVENVASHVYSAPALEVPWADGEAALDRIPEAAAPAHAYSGACEVGDRNAWLASVFDGAMRDCGVETHHPHTPAAAAAPLAPPTPAPAELRGAGMLDGELAADVVAHQCFQVNNSAAAGMPMLPTGVAFDGQSGASIAVTLYKHGVSALGADPHAAAHWLGGVRAHAPALLSILAPDAAQVPAMQAALDRMVRRPPSHDGVVHMPAVLPNVSQLLRAQHDLSAPFANAHLSLAAFLLAGLDGVRRKLAAHTEVVWPEPVMTLQSSLEALEGDQAFLLAHGALSPFFVRQLIVAKHAMMLCKEVKSTTQCSDEDAGLWFAHIVQQAAPSMMF